MKNTSSQSKKESILRALAVAGLVALILLIAWLTVQIVRVAPTAFNSLASLAEGISNYEEVDEAVDPLVIENPSETIIAGETANIRWNMIEGQTYSFTYTCSDETTVSLVDGDGLRRLSCEETYDLEERTDIELALDTTASTSEVTYSILTFSNTDETAVDTASGIIVVDNPNRPGFVAGESTSATTTSESESESTPEPEPVTPETEITLVIPESNPNGFTDLETQFVGVGETDAGLTPTLEQDSDGILFFSVRNIGTKTSEEWSFTVELPGGATYRSEDQAPLKPNERATLALTIETDDDSSHVFEVTVDTDEDRNDRNNAFSQRVRFVR